MHFRYCIHMYVLDRKSRRALLYCGYTVCTLPKISSAKWQAAGTDPLKTRELAQADFLARGVLSSGLGLLYSAADY